MYHTGFDIHKSSTMIQHLDDDGALGFQGKVYTSIAGFEDFFKTLDQPTRVVLEAGRGYWWIAQYLRDHPLVDSLIVVDPMRSRRVGKELAVQYGYGRAKNDRIDAEMLAQLDRHGMAVSIHVPTPEQLQLRSLVRFRTWLTNTKTRLANVFHGHLAMYGTTASVKKICGDAEYRKTLFERVPEDLTLMINQLLEQIALINNQIKKLDNRLDELLPTTHPQMQTLMRLNGYGPVFSRIVLSEIMDIANFQSHKHLNSYAGLAPVEDESAGKKGPIKLNRHCNYALKYAFIGVAHHARTEPRFAQKYRADEKKHGPMRAKINLARRIVRITYKVLARHQAAQA